MRQRSVEGPSRGLKKRHIALLCLLVPLGLLVPVSFQLGTNSAYLPSAVRNWTVQASTSTRNYTLAAKTNNTLRDAMGLLHKWIEARAKNTSVDNLCPLMSPHLRGPIKVDNSSMTWEFVNSHFNHISWGGQYHEKDCRSRHHVAIVIPYRDREEHLKIFLYNMVPVFVRQQLDFGIYVVEQLNGSDFNRGMLMNIGYREALKDHKYRCFVFSDVDLVLEDDRTSYGCRQTPAHLSVAIDTHSYKLHYSTIFGGVTSFRTDHFQRANGFSNQYFRWGGEDDDVRIRVVTHGLTIKRPAAKFARYKMLGHEKQDKNPERHDLLNHAKERMDIEGLNSLQYDVVQRQRKKLFTKISVRIDQSIVLKDLGYFATNKTVDNSTLQQKQQNSTL